VFPGINFREEVGYIMTYLKSLKCINCGAEISYEKLVYFCPHCGGLLDPLYDYDSIARNLRRDDISSRAPSIWKWKEFLPLIDESCIVSLGEGGTPLLRCTKIAKALGVRELYVKDDALTNPTGSLKDRQVSVAVSKAVELGYDTVFTITSGNNGASLAAYAAKAGLKCVVIFTAGATMEKMLMATALGAKAIKIQGEDSQVAAAINSVLSDERPTWYDCGFRVFEPFMFEGRKTNAMEVCESLKWKNPNRVLHPSVGSMGVIKAWKGYKELSSIGWTSGPLPKMTAVQPANVAPIVKAFNEGLDEIVSVDPGETIAEAIACVNTGDLGKWTLDVLRESGGSAVGVTDTELVTGLKLLAEEGVFVEPSAAVTIAAVEKLITEGIADKEETFVCEITGAGWKDFTFAQKTFGLPRVIQPKEEDIALFIREHLSN